MHVLYEDNHCLAVAKPAGLLTMGFPGAPRTLIDLARDYVKRRYRKPGNVFLGVVQRLDKPVSGVVLFARTSKAARRLAEQFRERTVEKTYWAVVEGTCRRRNGTWEDWLRKDRQRCKVVAVAPNAPEAKRAVMDFCRVRKLRIAVPDTAAGRPGTLLELQPHTGRTHQLRVQLACHALPIHGDRKYGSRYPPSPALRGAIALHARRLVFDHPVRHEPVTVEAPLPPGWHKCFSDLPD